MMVFSYVILKKARKELLDAWKWYEDRQEGLGDKFKNQVFQKITQILLNPERYPERKNNFREVTVAIFPYLLIYKISRKKKVITIVSVFHTRRNPGKKYTAK